MTETPNDQKELTRTALRKIKALCKGNGVRPNAVQLKHASGTIIQCQAITHLEIHTEVTEEQKKGRHSVGEIIDNPAFLQKKINDLTADTLKNPESRKYLANLLLERPDKGFSLHAEYFEIPSLKRDYCFHQACATCHGHGNQPCGRCGGQRKETCNQCHGRTMVPCKYCHGNGTQQGPDGKQRQCSRCFGQRQISCSLCQKTGYIACRQCKGSGTNTCSGCGGAAFFTHITHVIPKLKTLFEINRADLPHPVVKVFEDQGARMAERKHLHIRAEQIKRDDGGLAIQYDLEFPYGDLEFAINGKSFKTHLFGYKGKMLKLPNFLDKITAPYVALLTQAANGEGAVTRKIKEASEARMISQGLLLSVTMPKKKAMIELKKKFPMGISNDLLKNIILLSAKALANATRKTRFTALGAAMGAVAIIDSLYFLTPLRSSLIGPLEPSVVMALDFLLIGVGGYLGNLIVGFLSRRPLWMILGPLMEPKQRNKFKPKAPHTPWISYVASGGVLFAVLIIGKMIGAALPPWFPF